MIVRDARHTDVIAIANLLLASASGKAIIEVCRSRAAQCVKKARAPRGNGIAIVAERDTIEGFLFASPREAFDLCTNIVFCEVVFLVGRACAREMLRDLRGRGNMRIILPVWDCLDRPRALRRLIESEGYREFGAIYHN